MVRPKARPGSGALPAGMVQGREVGSQGGTPQGLCQRPRCGGGSESPGEEANIRNPLPGLWLQAYGQLRGGDGWVDGSAEAVDTVPEGRLEVTVAENGGI